MYLLYALVEIFKEWSYYWQQNGEIEKKWVSYSLISANSCLPIEPKQMTRLFPGSFSCMFRSFHLATG
jgi:hypothetical protein